MKLTLTVGYIKGEEVVLKTDPCVIRIVGRMLVDGRDVKYELIKGTEEPTWHFEEEIEKIRDSMKVFHVRGFTR